LTPAEERHLYETDYPAWCRYAAPKWRDMLLAATPAAKKEIWAKASEQMRDELRKLADQERKAA
jgi:hypothetical protein